LERDMMDGIEPDWIRGLAGGLMIGLAAALYLLVNGRILGASGIVGGLVDGTERRHAAERLAFVAALVAVPAAAVLWRGGYPTHLTSDPALLVAAGLLTGIGTRMANGCTSGHGVCGISRLTLRGIVATLAYVLAGVAVLTVLRHGLGVL
jgi:uncharacterized membrane protein YedE/YeeE